MPFRLTCYLERSAEQLRRKSCFYLEYCWLTMPVGCCTVWGNSRKKGRLLSCHRFPSNPHRRALWLACSGLRRPVDRVLSCVCWVLQAPSVCTLVPRLSNVGEEKSPVTTALRMRQKLPDFWEFAVSLYSSVTDVVKLVS